MKIGVFDSGLGGLVILRVLARRLPAYDYIYLGDTARVPYGNRSAATIYTFTRQAVEALFRRGCGLVILACNTASAAALRKLQRQWLPRHYPNRRILGVVVPTIEAAANSGNGPVGIIGTSFTIQSNVYPRELRKLQPRRKIYQQATPLLVPLIELNELGGANQIIRQYLRPLQAKKITTLVLGCTHYPLAAHQIRLALGRRARMFRQDQIIPSKLVAYLERHPRLERRLSRNHRRELLLTDVTLTAKNLVRRWFGSALQPKHIRLFIRAGA